MATNEKICPFCGSVIHEYEDMCPAGEKRIVNEILAGKWGNGRERKHQLEIAGYNYRYVQDRVNERLGIHKNSDALPLSPTEKTDLDRIIREAVDKPVLKDSGERREFESGAVRDIQRGKGRCDLLPLDVIAAFYHEIDADCPANTVLFYIDEFKTTGYVPWLYSVLRFTPFGNNFANMFLELAIHFEDGAVKYGENNWQKGIPVNCYIDSAVRHYLKFLRGDTDEPHDRAFVWNIVCAIWTCIHKPELNPYRKKDE